MAAGWPMEPPRSPIYFFADDILLFFKANLQEAEVVKQCLRTYEDLSGQAVNLHKCNICFSKNTTGARGGLIAGVSGVTGTENVGKCLGLPSFVGWNKRAVFTYIEEKITQRISAWNKRLLRREGKEILLKTIARAMPTFSMSVFLIPNSLCSAERTMSRFWWGYGGSNGRGIHWMAWVFKAKYFPKSSFIDAAVGNCPSYCWRSVMASHDLICSEIRRRIGDGAGTLL
ncbi:unnamed protein product [Cuscuta campestris]|uniref:Reverse transcriptase domain-containing protein n=1 Tax=Cuscuta campestris TaxID=132261 RepID=A0A484KEH5_9ASTE|nr:unnamed protein product [Cuscuta campestris]